MQRPQPLHFSRSSTTGTSPVAGLISSSNAMQPLTQTLTQRPQPLQYSGIRYGFGFSLTWAIGELPAPWWQGSDEARPATLVTAAADCAWHAA